VAITALHSGERGGFSADRSSIEALGSKPGRHYRGPALASSGRRAVRLGVLAAKTESFDQGPIALHVRALEVAQQASASADELKQPSLSVEVVLVDFHVFGQVGDPPAEQRDLDLGRSGVTVDGGVLGHDLLLDSGVERH
jgi:hypothetical protein